MTTKVWKFWNQNTESTGWKFFIILSILIIAGFFLRAYDLGTQSAWFDEAISGIAAKGFLNNGIPILPSGNGYTRAILHTSLVALSFAAFGFGEASGRIPAAIFGTFCIPVAFLIGRRMKSERVGILLAFFVTFATVQIAWSRQIRFYQQLQFFFLLSLYLLERFLAKTNWKRFVPLLVSVFCMTVSHDAFGYVLAIPILIWFFVEKSTWIWDKITNPKEVEGKDWAGVVLLLVSFATILYLRGIPGGNIHAVSSWEVNYSSQYIDHFRGEMGPLFLLAVPGALLALLERKRNLLYVISLLLPFYVVSLHVLALQYRYVFMLFPLLFALAALTLDYVYERIKGSTPQLQKGKIKLKSIIPIIVVIIVLIPMVSAAKFTFTPKTHYNLGRTAPQGEFRPAYDYIEKNWRENDVIVSTLTPVTWFYLQKSDYWISFSPWGFHTLPDRDSYTAAKVVQRLSQIKKVAENKHGWAIIDRMGMSRANRRVLDYIRGNFGLVEEVSGHGKGVWVYRWD